jgi:hypothetical protein
MTWVPLTARAYDKIDVSAFATSAVHAYMYTSGLSNTLYVQQTSVFNPTTDLAISVSTTTAGGFTASDLVF